MEKETKKYLIIGAVLILTVSIGVVLWKKYQTGEATNQAASDQSNQDELALLASSLASNAYAGQVGGAQPYSASVVGSSVPQSLSDEVLALERALGFAPPDTTTPVPTGATPAAGAPASGAPANPPQAPAQNTGTTGDATHGQPTPLVPHPASEMIKFNHGAPLFEMDIVSHEGVTVA